MFSPYSYNPFHHISNLPKRNSLTFSCTSTTHKQPLVCCWTAGVRSPTEAEDFSSDLCVQTGSGAHPASYIMGTGGSFPKVKRGQGVILTAHPLLVSRSRKSRSCTSCHPNAPLWSVTGPLYITCLLHAWSWIPCPASSFQAATRCRFCFLRFV
jgi:hypothetical protein